MIYHYNDDDDKPIKKVFNDDEEQCDKHIWAMPANSNTGLPCF